MISKKDLKEGSYYLGTCRNTNIAKWFKGEFIFINMFFDKPYIEKIPHYFDVKDINQDGFIPIDEIKINFNDVIEEKNKQDYKNYSRNIHRNLNTKSISTEEWKPIKDYENEYLISNLGRVKKMMGNKIMKQNFIREYLVVGLTDSNGIRKTHRIHRLVASAFCKCNDDNNIIVNHINCVKTDNRALNLEWVSNSQNSRHTFTSGHRVKKLNITQVLEIKKMLELGDKQMDIAAKYNISRSTVSEINTGKKWVDVKA